MANTEVERYLQRSIPPTSRLRPGAGARSTIVPGTGPGVSSSSSFLLGMLHGNHIRPRSRTGSCIATSRGLPFALVMIRDILDAVKRGLAAADRATSAANWPHALPDRGEPVTRLRRPTGRTPCPIAASQLPAFGGQLAARGRNLAAARIPHGARHPPDREPVERTPAQPVSGLASHLGTRESD